MRGVTAVGRGKRVGEDIAGCSTGSAQGERKRGGEGVHSRATKGRDWEKRVREEGWGLGLCLRLHLCLSLGLGLCWLSSGHVYVFPCRGHEVGTESV